MQGAVGEGQEEDLPKPKKARAPKEYVPKVGSANYAFLVVMYMVSGGHVHGEWGHMQGEVGHVQGEGGHVQG